MRCREKRQVQRNRCAKKEKKDRKKEGKKMRYRVEIQVQRNSCAKKEKM